MTGRCQTKEEILLNDSTPVEELRNLGRVSAGRLRKIGVGNLGELKAVGAETAFEHILVLERSRRFTPTVSVNLLYALWGAINDVDWREIPAKQKVYLQELAVRVQSELN